MTLKEDKETQSRQTRASTVADIMKPWCPSRRAGKSAVVVVVVVVNRHSDFNLSVCLSVCLSVRPSSVCLSG